jgi:hypothetical protein
VPEADISREGMRVHATLSALRALSLVVNCVQARLAALIGDVEGGIACEEPARHQAKADEHPVVAPIGGRNRDEHRDRKYS